MNDRHLRIGRDPEIEDGVTLGRPPERDVGADPLVIGDNARIRAPSVIYAGTTIGHDLETGHGVVIREQNSIGDGLSIWSNSYIDYGCVLGSRVKVHALCYIAQFTEIADGVFIGPGVAVTNDIHPGCECWRECMRGPRIEEGAVIGGNATLLPRVVVGRKALVGAGSVVVHDVPPEMVVVGNPARVICSIYELECSTGLTDKPYRR